MNTQHNHATVITICLIAMALLGLIDHLAKSNLYPSNTTPTTLSTDHQ